MDQPAHFPFRITDPLYPEDQGRDVVPQVSKGRSGQNLGNGSPGQGDRLAGKPGEKVQAFGREGQDSACPRREVGPRKISTKIAGVVGNPENSFSMKGIQTNMIMITIVKTALIKKNLSEKAGKGKKGGGEARSHE